MAATCRWRSTAPIPEGVRALLIIDTGPGFKKDEAREGWNKRAHETGERFEREGLEVLESARQERSSVTHRDASGLARAARGMLTQRDARVMESCRISRCRR